MNDFLTISEQNKGKYGTDIGRFGRMLLAERYSDRSHFIYELLQNAEDALKRRPLDWSRRTVEFELTETELTISHFGVPFSGDDVRGVCGIDESTKEITDIGRFGIGFKSVNAYTDRPEVHSGTTHFSIERYVHPVEVPSIECGDEETRIVLPFREDDPNASREIAKSLTRLGVRTLLFLRQIDSIEWSAFGEDEGVYLRSPRRGLDFGAERITVVGEDKATSGGHLEEDWIVFSKPVTNPDGVEVGHSELAFLVEYDSGTDSPIRVLPASHTELVVYFPTIVTTKVGFLIQGPYRTTPSRDNVVHNNPWNLDLVCAAARLLVSALKGLRGLGLLDTDALRTLPIDPETFDDEHMFGPLFEATRDAFRQHRFLPSHDGNHIVAGRAKLARGQELRELLNSQQLSSLFADGVETQWLDAGITQDLTPELQNYLVRELGIKEITPETAVRRLDTRFLEEQTDTWIEELYVFLAGQSALRSRGLLTDLALVRLEDGSHVPARDSDGNVCAFLPGDAETGFPTVRETVCRRAEARGFLDILGLSEPDLVDDVVTNVLPQYSSGAGASEEQYASDVRRILAAFETDSSERRRRLEKALSETPFVAAFDAASRESVFASPGEVYIASQRLRELFGGVEGVLLVSDTPPLGTEESRNMLVAAGAARHLKAEACKGYFTSAELLKMRTNAGCTKNTGINEVEDRTLRGMDGLLELLPKLDIAAARRRASLLWEALCDLEERSGHPAFRGTYLWYYRTTKRCFFEATFVERLRTFEWIVGEDGVLRSTAETTFEELGWKENQPLRERLRFKPRHLDQLAVEAGFEPQALSLLRKFGLTTEVQLQALLDRPVPSGRSDSKDRAPTSAAQPKPITYIQARVEDVDTEGGGEAHARRMEIEECGIQLILADEPVLQRTGTNNPGFDLVEKNAADRELRWVEVKAISGAFDDCWVGLSHVQFETALHRREDFWLYVVEHVATPDLARIIRIQDPAGQAKTFVFDHGWQAIATEAP